MATRLETHNVQILEEWRSSLNPWTDEGRNFETILEAQSIAYSADDCVRKTAIPRSPLSCDFF